ncbi:Uncharacterised protein [Achromobacter sp. 2789STDY5608633]|nr:Uncharacterised protein [Achromobacter sp. 2789STDY5608633]CUJ75403.1 Uncharacterised protein [Achromobacter sp. 2789STDY5608628]
MLFGDRIAADVLSQTGPSRSLLKDENAYDDVLNLAEKIGVNLVSGKN